MKKTILLFAFICIFTGVFTQGNYQIVDNKVRIEYIQKDINSNSDSIANYDKRIKCIANETFENNKKNSDTEKKMKSGFFVVGLIQVFTIITFILVN